MMMVPGPPSCREPAASSASPRKFWYRPPLSRWSFSYLVPPSGGASATSYHPSGGASAGRSGGLVSTLCKRKCMPLCAEFLEFLLNCCYFFLT